MGKAYCAPYRDWERALASAPKGGLRLTFNAILVLRQYSNLKVMLLRKEHNLLCNVCHSSLTHYTMNNSSSITFTALLSVLYNISELVPPSLYQTAQAQ